MNLACIDMEGVLIPELWPIIARETGIPALAATTRECPDYATLVNQRIALLKSHHIGLARVVDICAAQAPLPGAIEFLAALSPNWRILIVSDAFQQMLAPLLAKLGRPDAACHVFDCDGQGYINAARYTRSQGKQEAIAVARRDYRRIMAVGDALNDLAMLRAADQGYLFRPSATTRQALRPDDALTVEIVDGYPAILERCARISA